MTKGEGNCSEIESYVLKMSSKDELWYELASQTMMVDRDLVDVRQSMGVMKQVKQHSVMTQWMYGHKWNCLVLLNLSYHHSQAMRLRDYLKSL